LLQEQQAYEESLHIHFRQLYTNRGNFVQASPLWTLHGDHKITLAALQDMRTRLSSAKSILIAGGGPVGVETAGEIASLYKDKEITFLSGTTRLLPRLQSDKAGNGAQRQLASLAVKTLHNVRVTSSKATEGNKVRLALSDGTTRTVDIFIDATGGVPNTSFLPAAWLDDTKRVATDISTLRTTKAPAGVYAIGDAASYTKGSVADASWAAPALGYSIWSDLHAAATKDGRLKAVGMAGLKEKKYKQFEKDMQIVPVGPKGGVGVIFGWSVPSFLVRSLKAKTFMLEKAAGLAEGSEVLKP
jgi:apoptosis-inducing factor 2